MVIRVRDIVITVVNRRTTSGGEYVGRPSVLGNPFEIKQGVSRDLVITAYREWLSDKIHNKDTKVCAALDRLRRKAIRDRSLTLACWCVPLPCHATVIADFLAKAIASNRTFGDVGR